MKNELLGQGPVLGPMSRRDLLKWLGGTGLLMAGGCASSTTTPSPANQPLSAADLIATTVSNNPTFALRVAFLNYPSTLDPARAGSMEAIQVIYALYDALVYIAPDLTPEPLLAAGWQEAPDRLSWTFDLEREVRFHNGMPLTSADVVYTFNRLLDPAVESPMRLVLGFIAQVEALDEYTVRFVLSAPNEDLPLLLGIPLTGIVPQGMSTIDLTAQPTGAGAWQLASVVSGESIRLTRNPNYWDEAFSMQFETLIYRYFPSIPAQVEAMLAREIDLVPDVPPDNLNQFIENPEIGVQEVPSGRYQAIVMRVDLQPFYDLQVREALKLCLDRPAMQELILAGRGTLASDQPISPIHPFWVELPPPPYDPQQARQLLAQAGYPNGLQLTLITAAIEPGMVEMAYAYRDMALPAGVAVEVITVPPDIYLADYAGRAPFHVVNWGLRPSVDETLTTAYHSQSPANYSHWNNPQLDDLIVAARSEPDPALRAARYRTIQELIAQEGCSLIPCFRPVLMAAHKSLEGFSSHPTGWLDYSGVHPVSSS